MRWLHAPSACFFSRLLITLGWQHMLPAGGTVTELVRRSRFNKPKIFRFPSWEPIPPAPCPSRIASLMICASNQSVHSTPAPHHMSSNPHCRKSLHPSNGSSSGTYAATNPPSCTSQIALRIPELDSSLCPQQCWPLTRAAVPEGSGWAPAAIKGEAGELIRTYPHVLLLSSAVMWLVS